MNNKAYFLRDDLETYKPKYLLLCEKCVADFPHFVQAFSAQKVKKETENRLKTIIITEVVV